MFLCPPTQHTEPLFAGDNQNAKSYEEHPLKNSFMCFYCERKVTLFSLPASAEHTWKSLYLAKI